jgi:hypothetical protein
MVSVFETNEHRAMGVDSPAEIVAAMRPVSFSPPPGEKQIIGHAQEQTKKEHKSSIAGSRALLKSAWVWRLFRSQR